MWNLYCITFMTSVFYMYILGVSADVGWCLYTAVFIRFNIKGTYQIINFVDVCGFLFSISLFLDVIYTKYKCIIFKVNNEARQ